MRRKILFMAIAFLSVGLSSLAQTYRHDASIMNQFTVMELGAGALTPAAYYNMFHKGYQVEAYANNKNYLREKFNQNVVKQQASSDSVRSNLVKRAKVEDTYTVSRDPNLDVSWRLEQEKVERKMNAWYDNINKIMLIHPNPAESRSIKNDWMERYKCIQNDLMIIHKSRLTMGDRQSQYLKLYRRIVSENSKLVSELYTFNSMRRVKNATANAGSLKRHSGNATLAQACLNNWTSKFGVGGFGKK